MARFYKCFVTQEERDAWEKEQKSKDASFKVCMRMPVKQLIRDLGIHPLSLNKYRYATIYRFKED